MNRLKLCIPVILLLLLSGCSSYDEKTIKHVLEKEDFTNIKKIVIRDGSTGDTKTITDATQMAKILSLIHDVVLYKDDDQEPRDGFLYTLTFKEDAKKLSISDKLIHNTYYTTKPNLAHIIETFYEQLILNNFFLLSTFLTRVRGFFVRCTLSINEGNLNHYNTIQYDKVTNLYEKDVKHG